MIGRPPIGGTAHALCRELKDLSYSNVKKAIRQEKGYNTYMKKFATDLIGSDILAYEERVRIGKVEEIIIDPLSGNLLGLSSIIRNKKVVIPINEIRSFGPSFILTNGIDSISGPEEVIRIKEALSFGAKIINEKVETESSQKLGRATNYTIDINSLRLDKIYVTVGTGLKFLSSDLIIPNKNIVEIQKKKIIVTDLYAKAKKPAVNMSPSPVIE